MTRCGDCGGNTTWDEEVCSSICTSCGTLQDPSQSILDSHLDQHDNSAREYNPLWDPAASTTLKGIRGNGWNLAGQGKEARDRKNTYAMHEFIRSIASRLSNPGLSPRAVTLFTQAMTRGRYRWGRKAKRTAGASIAVALRESHKPDAIRDIAYLIDEPLKSLNRAFTNLVTLLQLDVPSVDPALHLPTLQTYLQSLINPTPPPSLLSPTLLKMLTPLPLPSVLNTAASLCTLFSRLTVTLAPQSTRPTACAILMLSLEAEVRSSLPSIGELAQLLSARLGLCKDTAMVRYKVVYDLIEEWIREVPWLEQFESKGNEKGRSKLAKRTVVARGIKDVIQFQEEIWRKKLETRGKLDVELDADEDADDDNDDDGTLSTTTGLSLRSNAKMKQALQDPGSTSSTHARKKRKIKHQDLDDASQFLLDPLNASLPAIGTQTPDSHSAPFPPRSATPDTVHLPLTSYLLAASPTSLSLSHNPTRLQLLVAQRAGGAEDIGDEELFGEGELDGFLRADEEVNGLRGILEWENGTETAPKGGAGIQTGKGKGRAGVKAPKAKKAGTTRVNMDALARILRGDLTDDDGDGGKAEGEEEDKDENDEDSDEREDRMRDHRYKFMQVPANDQEEVEEWRPLSPDMGRGAYDGLDRYDQEY